MNFLFEVCDFMFDEELNRYEKDKKMDKMNKLYCLNNDNMHMRIIFYAVQEEEIFFLVFKRP